MPKNDRPTSLHMGFGYEQARAAGLGGIRADRSARQVNRLVKENKAARQAISELRAEKNDPEWGYFIKHRVAEGHGEQEIAREVYWIKRFSRQKERGFSLAFRLKHDWPYSN